jgi:AbrB family looped-hinge helix DNA binding protein
MYLMYITICKISNSHALRFPQYFSQIAHASVIFLHNSYRYRRCIKMPATATLSSKYQISIPKSVREEQHWQAGQQFVFIPKGKGMLVMPVPSFDELRGIAVGADLTDFRDRNDRF